MGSCAPETFLGKFVALLGPTASGKSSLAMRIVDAFPEVEIVNCDSRQIYREMLIGTAAPSEADRRRVPHHLFGFVDPDRSFSAGEYEKRGRGCLHEIWSRRKIPLVVGGTGFYFEALVEGLPLQDFDPGTRRKVQEKLERDGLPALVAELNRIDPEAVNAVDVKNPRRVCRALELIYQSGLPLAKVRTDRRKFEAESLVFLVILSKTELDLRVERRVDEMVEAGLEKEVRELYSRYGPDAVGLKTIGYSEWASFLKGTGTREQVIGEIKAHSRQYAKRQVTWFKNRAKGDFLSPEEIREGKKLIEAMKIFFQP